MVKLLYLQDATSSNAAKGKNSNTKGSLNSNSTSTELLTESVFKASCVCSCTFDNIHTAQSGSLKW